MGELLQRYENVEAVLGDVVAFRATTGRIHRPVEDAEAWCGSTVDTEYVELTRALAVGAELCKSCYRPALAHLARLESSPVVDTEAEPGTAAAPDSPGTLPEPASPVEELGAITAAVLVVPGSGGNTYHAPGPNDEPVCQTDEEAVRRRVDQTAPSARPCRRCFADAVVERYRGRDGDEHAAAEAVEARR